MTMDMTIETKNPAVLHDPTAFGYSHTARVPADAKLVFVSGQYGSGTDGNVVSEVFADQVQQAFSNLEACLDAHGLHTRDVAQLRTYVVGLSFDELAVIAAAVKQRWGGQPPAQTVLGVQQLAMPGMRFEVEAVAAG